MDAHDSSLSDMWWMIAPWFLQNLVWIPTRILLHFFFHIRIEGGEHLGHLSGPVIFAVNHTSFWDPIIMTGSLPWFSRRYPMLYVAREHTYYNKYGRFIPMFLFKLWGAHPAHGGLKDYAASLATHKQYLERGRSLCLFPEGKVARVTEELQPFKGGIGYLVHATDAVTIPVTITGMFGFKTTDMWSRSRHIHVTFGAPISSSALFPEDTGRPEAEEFKRAAGDIREHMSTMLAAHVEKVARTNTV